MVGHPPAAMMMVPGMTVVVVVAVAVEVNVGSVIVVPVHLSVSLAAESSVSRDPYPSRGGCGAWSLLPAGPLCAWALCDGLRDATSQRRGSLSTRVHVPSALARIATHGACVCARWIDGDEKV